ncbi:MAG: hypothetical protein Q8P02_01835, partial [Candidatus Micrarchaeota archaeon]|nr:hypothetical protein [Candidatus Micrarchaeota archaeon]
VAEEHDAVGKCMNATFGRLNEYLNRRKIRSPLLKAWQDARLTEKKKRAQAAAEQRIPKDDVSSIPPEKIKPVVEVQTGVATERVLEVSSQMPAEKKSPAPLRPRLGRDYPAQSKKMGGKRGRRR